MLAMDKGVVEEWLSEYKILPETSIPSYAASLKDKNALVSELFSVIHQLHSEFLEPVCHQLFEFYRSGESRLQRFTLQFLPELIWCYLNIISCRDLQSSGCIEALLLGIYNLEIVTKDGQNKVLSFTIPSLSKPSVFHEPSSIGSVALTEAALSQHGLTRVVYSGPHAQRETFTAQNRFEVLSVLLHCYSSALSFMPSASLQSLCHLCSRSCVYGYPRQHIRKYKGVNNRIPLSSDFMVQLLTGVYYAIYSGEWDLARKALDDIIYRAQLELYPEPLLVANAIKASLPQRALKSMKEGTKCIQVEIAPTASRISRNAVTSMSIRGHRWKGHDNPSCELQDELMEIAEVDEGFCSRTASNTSQHALLTNNISKIQTGKNQRRSGGGKAARESITEICREQLLRKPGPRAASENLELLSLKRLTLTTSHSLPKPGSQNLAKTATAIFSKSFEQVTSVFAPNNSANSGAGLEVETNRFSACSLQEENLLYVSERTELLKPNPRLQNQQCSPNISITLSTDI